MRSQLKKEVSPNNPVLTINNESCFQWKDDQSNQFEWEDLFYFDFKTTLKLKVKLSIQVS